MTVYTIERGALCRWNTAELARHTGIDSKVLCGRIANRGAYCDRLKIGDVEVYLTDPTSLGGTPIRQRNRTSKALMPDLITHGLGVWR